MGGTGKYVASPYTSHGFNFQGSSSFQPNGYGGNYNQNGLYNVNEIGWEPKFGKSQLEGKYALGSYIWGQNNTSFTPTTWVAGQKKPTAFSENNLIWGLYLQADQQLYRAKSDDPAKPSKNGLYSFNEFSFTPPQNNALPFYFQTGLVYKGLIPKRENDSLGVALGAGFYSSYYNQYIDSQNQALVQGYGTTPNAVVPNGPTTTSLNELGAPTPYKSGSPTSTTNKAITKANNTQNNYYEYLPHYSSTEVIEGFYNIQLTKWASLKPGVQYIINPAGNGTVGNDVILQVVAKVTF
jgi:carbohydrate-selective porin OprB